LRLTFKQSGLEQRVQPRVRMFGDNYKAVPELVETGEPRKLIRRISILHTRRNAPDRGRSGSAVAETLTTNFTSFSSETTMLIVG